MKTITVTIEGVASLLQHRFGEQAEGDVQAQTRLVGSQRAARPGKKRKKVTPPPPDGTHYHPGASIARLLRGAGSNPQNQRQPQERKICCTVCGDCHRGYYPVG